MLTQKLERVLQSKKSKKIGVIGSIAFFLTYLYSIDSINIHLTSVGVETVPNWTQRLLDTRAPYLWEPVLRLDLGLISLFLHPLNILLALLLSFLVFLTITTMAYMYKNPKTCRVNKTGIMGVLPASLTGFACCAPSLSLLLAPILGASSTVLFINILPFFIPLSTFLLLLGIYLLLKDIEPIS